MTGVSDRKSTRVGKADPDCSEGIMIMMPPNKPGLLYPSFLLIIVPPFFQAVIHNPRLLFISLCF